MKFNYTIVAWKENGDSPEVLERVDEALLAEERRDYWSNKNQENVTHITGTLESVNDQNFDLILANIYGDILLALAKPLVAKLKPGGTMLLSGILWEFNFDVRQDYEREAFAFAGYYRQCRFQISSAGGR